MNNGYRTSQYQIHALHGFLGNPGDWSLYEDENDNFHAYHLFKDFAIQPFEGWAKEFNQMILSHEKKSAEHILLGYSLGGRLGLHALLQKQENWKAAILVSTHPGLDTIEEKQKRMFMDDFWAHRFRNDPWELLMKDWNNQSVFKDSVDFNRKESDNDRIALSEAIKTWSLGRQRNLNEDIAALKMPICWIVGENDKKFLAQVNKLKFKHPKSHVCIVLQSGHRVLLDQPKKLLLNISKFINDLE